jgi:peptide-methionine (S)-S-oxide reductase
MKTYFYKLILFLTCTLICLTAVAETKTAIFAGGCFWSMQHDFDKVNGVVSTTVGYTGGTVPNPSYEQVSTGNTGHYESIEVQYDPAKISYPQLLSFFVHDIDPTDPNGEFCDKGNEYHSVIFYNNAEQKNTAIKMKNDLIQSKKFPNIATQILPAQTFYPAEEYHQKYSEKNPENYAAYRLGCQRDQHLQDVWGK